MEFNSRSNPHTRAYGQSIEDRAIHYFARVEPRARLITRNYRKRFGEIDLIFALDREWIFVEVRARRGRGLEAPLQSGIESISWKKASRLRRVIASFMQEARPTLREESELEARLDVLDWNGREFRHYRNVWL